MKLDILIVFLFTILLTNCHDTPSRTAPAAASPNALAQGTDLGNGGGGIRFHQDESVMTFGSAKLKVRTLETMELPAVLSLMNILNGIRMPLHISEKWQQAVLTSADRHYTVVDQELYQSYRETIAQQYANLTGYDVSKITIFAITDTKTFTTLLFPDFFNLTSLEQAIILWHEAAWIVKPHASYAEILNFEIAAQSFVLDQKSPERIVDFYLRLSDLFDDPDILPSGFWASTSLQLGAAALECLLESSAVVPLNSSCFAEILSILRETSTASHVGPLLSAYLNRGGKIFFHAYRGYIDDKLPGRLLLETSFVNKDGALIYIENSRGEYAALGFSLRSDIQELVRCSLFSIHSQEFPVECLP